MDDEKQLEGIVNEQGFVPDDTLLFDFDGKAKLGVERKERTAVSQELVQHLNSELPMITEMIGADLKAKLPPGTNIKVELEFSHGSIEWSGIVFIADWIARIADNISFAEYVARAARFSINKVVRGRIEQKAPVRSISTTITKRKEAKPFHPVSRFLWWCSGTVPDLIHNSKTDHAKYQGIGGAVLTTGVLAFFSGFYAMFTLFEGSPYQVPFGLFFGLVWALAIFNLDRYIVSSMKKEPRGEGNPFIRFLRELAPAIPRLLLAVVIGITISKPLELRLFQGTIDEQIGFNHDRLTKEKEASIREIHVPRLAELSKEIGRLDSEIQAKENRARHLEDEFHKEMDSTGGSGKYGYSTVAKLKEKTAIKARGEVEPLREERARLQLQKDRLEREIELAVDLFNRNPKSDFFIRMRALSDLTKKYDSVRWANYFLIFLFVFVESTPVIVKLLSPVGPYDVKLDLREEIEARAAEHKRNAMNEIAAYHYRQLTEGERYADDLYSPLRDQLREQRLHQAFQQWQAQGFNLQGPSFEELQELIKDHVFTTRKP